jgi:hypothetical protein
MLEIRESDARWLRVSASTQIIFLGVILALLITPGRDDAKSDDLPERGRGRQVTVTVRGASVQPPPVEGPRFPRRKRPEVHAATVGAFLEELRELGRGEGLGALESALAALRPSAPPSLPPLIPKRIDAPELAAMDMDLDLPRYGVGIEGEREPDLREPEPPPHPRRPLRRDIIVEYSREDLRAHIQAEAIPVVERCYEEALTRDPAAGGKLLTRWTIGPTGIPFRFEATPVYGAIDRRLVRCVRAGLKALPFMQLHPSTQALTIVYPFILSR